MADTMPDTVRDLEEARKEIGVPLERGTVWHPVATETAIRRFALAMGDDNPLWTDSEYARKSRFGNVVAPPYFIQATEPNHVAMILLQYSGGLYLKGSVRFLRPIRPGTEIRATSFFSDFEERKMKSGQPMIFIHQDFDYVDAATGDMLATSSHLVTRFTPTSQALAEAPPLPSAEQVQEIQDAQASYQRRGADPRWLDEVRVGDQIGPLVLGPLTTLDFSGKVVQVGQHNATHRNATSRDVAEANVKVRTAGGEPTDAVGFRDHVDVRRARMRGIGGVFDFGQARMMWASRLFTDWMGDDADLLEMEVEIRRPTRVGEALTFKAVVASMDPESSTIDAELKVTEFVSGELKSKGRATMRLPKRGPAR